MKVFSFVAAASNSGKTTLIESVVRILKAKGLRVAVIKHASKGFDLLQPQANAYLKSGAESVIVSGLHMAVLLRHVEAWPSMEDLQRDIGDVDVTLYEGFKADARNKIEVFRLGVSGSRPFCVDDPSYLALATDTKYDVAIPQVGLNDAESVAEFILAKWKQKSAS